VIRGEGQQHFASPEEALAHYGVKGMKWGVRKERKTNPGDAAKVAGVNRRLAAIGATYAALVVGRVYTNRRDTRRRKYDDGAHYQEKQAGREWKKNHDLAKKMSVDELYKNVVKPINPKYGKAGTKANCRRATFAYELRRRGHNVKATPSHFATGQSMRAVMNVMGTTQRPQSVWGMNMIGDRQTMAAIKPAQRAQRVFDALNKNPDGARGELAFAWKYGGGHSVAWEKLDGKTVIFDAQSGITWRDAKSLTKYAPVMSETAYTRLDNAKLDTEFLKRWAVDADED